MKKYPLSFSQLHDYSQEQPFIKLDLDKDLSDLLCKLEFTRKSLGFPAITKDVGQFLRFISSIHRPTKIFEFGSGYGHSAFWYFLNNPNIEKVFLTEKNPNLLEYFESMPWPVAWKNKMDYFQGNAFDRLKEVTELDLILVDGLKATYLEFLKLCESKLSREGIVVIDNAYWRGSFLDPKLNQQENSAKAIKELHDYIQHSSFWLASFLPFQDGVILLRPNL